MCIQDAKAVHCNRVRAELEVAKQKTKEEDDVSVLPSMTKHTVLCKGLRHFPLFSPFFFS